MGLQGILKRQKFYSGFKGEHQLQLLNVACKAPEDPAHLQWTYDGECLTCHERWYESLPWHWPTWKQSYTHSDEALFEMIFCKERERASLRQMKRFTCAIYDCFDGEQGPEWDGVTCEMFGIELGEVTDKQIEDYPFGRIFRRDRPNLLIRHLRSRYWFESQMGNYPIYIEFLFLGFGEVETAIKWNDSRLEIKPEEKAEQENRIWRLYNFLTTREASAQRLTYTGDWRSKEIKEMWANENVLKQIAMKFDEIHEMWSVIKTLAYKCDSKDDQDEWLAQMSRREVIKHYLARYPELLTKNLLRRAVASSLSPTDREPRQLAYFHVASVVEEEINGEVLSIVDAYRKYQGKELAPISLDRYYKKAKTLPSVSVQA